ncbi:translation initiation factor IF-2-like isoform X28 [Drosophila albomicans]|uniref:Translation initiation factor IF-2-like isoform X28 n=1 Tax=Drosophila albomicans TaxID=7291 RepID=A0A9C6SR23_DROAB|nr:translation initiation factor IF-2-like isoform X28 [Drosophila albomicans]
MTGCVHRRVITEDLNRKASSAIGDFFYCYSKYLGWFCCLQGLVLCFEADSQFASTKCLRKPQLVQRSTPAGPLGQRSAPESALSASGAPSPALTASGAPLQRPAEHLSGPHGQRSTPAPALSASGAPLRPSRPAEHPCNGQRSTSPALSASGAPLRPSRPAEHPCTGPLGQRSASTGHCLASEAPLGANFNSLPSSSNCFCEIIL